jgi:hypothetical protein
MAPPAGAPVQDPISRWGDPTGIEHPATVMFESEKRLTKDAVRGSTRRRGKR